MKANPLWKISVVTTSEAEEAVAELLQFLFGSTAGSYTDHETGRTTVTLYLSKRPDWPALRSDLVAGLARIRRCGLAIGAGRVSCQSIRREDWAESWKRHFQPLQIGSTLLIKPSWSRRRPRKGQAVVVLDPGLSFGTGQHPTTGFCLRQLAGRRNRNIRQAVLDIGTGSGILAIAAAKLGYAPVDAFDFDPESVRVARANARRNRVGHRIHLRQADLMRLPKPGARQFDVICANLISTLLVSGKNRILARLKPRGVVVMAGILKTEFSVVRSAFEKLGLKLIASHSEKEWRSGAFVRRITA